nr:MAG TPA: hypothetical protein [Caudoviricetes sp.]
MSSVDFLKDKFFSSASLRSFPPLFLTVPFSPSIHSLNLGEIRFFRLFELLTQAVYFCLCGTKRKNLPPLEPLVELLAHHQRSSLLSRDRNS